MMNIEHKLELFYNLYSVLDYLRILWIISKGAIFLMDKLLKGNSLANFENKNTAEDSGAVSFNPFRMSPLPNSKIRKLHHQTHINYTLYSLEANYILKSGTVCTAMK